MLNVIQPSCANSGIASRPHFTRSQDKGLSNDPRCDVRLWPKADMPKNAIDVAFRGKADMTFCAANVCFRGQSGHHVRPRWKCWRHNPRTRAHTHGHFTHQIAEALQRREAGAALVEIGRSYNVSHSTISRL